MILERDERNVVPIAKRHEGELQRLDTLLGFESAGAEADSPNVLAICKAVGSGDAGLSAARVRDEISRRYREAAARNPPQGAVEEARLMERIKGQSLDYSGWVLDREAAADDPRRESLAQLLYQAERGRVGKRLEKALDEESAASQAIEALVQQFEKRHPDWSALKARDAALRSPEGQRLYTQQVKASRRVSARMSNE